MGIGRGLLAGALLLAALYSESAQAQTAVFARRGDWEAYGGLSDGAKAPVCGITQKTNDRSLAIKFYQGDKTFTVHMTGKQWRLKENDEYAVTMSIYPGGDWVVEKSGATATRFTDGNTFLVFEVAVEELDMFVREFRAGSQMRFTFPKVEPGGWTVSLTGSNEISDAFDRCRRAQKASDGAILGQPLQWCFKSEGPTGEQIVEGCTAIIGAGLWTGKDAALPLNRRALGYEIKGDYDHVIADMTEVLRLQPSAAGYATRGRAHFVRADFSAATADFSKAAELTDDEPYAMIWRFLARRHVGPEGATELSASAAKLKDQDWPYAVIDFYLGRRSAEGMQAAAATPEQKCEAAFYLAEWLLLRANAAEATPLLQSAATTCPEGFVERSAALAELAKLPR
ncbi:MAG TPA: hypothetical protein VMI56_20490 [Reyranella sp.]|nr:hypothetical protein [Reyranella sp.]